MRINEPIGKWIAKLYKHHDQFVDERLESYNLNHSEANLLYYLYKDGDGISQQSLKDNLAVDKATVSRSVSTLIEKGYLKKESSPEDKRINLIFITSKAEEIESVIDDIYQEWFNLFDDKISDHDQNKVIETLKRMYEIVINEIV
ncbi:MAG: MarR family winged helix-turn-helix transcriptional regulator [Halanaerobium sp.]